MPKCKISVFCICFLFFFLIGTICGVLGCRLMISTNAAIFCCYSKNISNIMCGDFWKLFLSTVRPFAIILVLPFVPSGYRLVFPLVAARAFIATYAAAAFWIGYCDLRLLLLRDMLLFPLFYAVCKRSYFSSRGIK